MFLIYIILVNFLSVSILSEPIPIQTNQNVTSTTKASAVATKKVNNTKIIAAEGGAIVDNSTTTPALTLLKQNDISKEIIKESSVVKSSPKVVPRKGAPLFIANDVTEKDKVKMNTQVTSSTPVPLTSKNYHKNKTDTTNLNVKSNTVPPVKKPLILSYEALASMDVAKVNNLNIPALKSSPDTAISNQVPSPEESEATPIKYDYLNKNNSHPELIMPFVISILLVPMFAVVGYMVFRRGRDAWKNRHYKRMDFLLDGMYND